MKTVRAKSVSTTADGTSGVLELRSRLIATALEWQERFGVAPAITNALFELDSALLIGMTADAYGLDCSNRTAVTRGHDFVFCGCRYQVKGNRPSGRKGSPVTRLNSRLSGVEHLCPRDPSYRQILTIFCGRHCSRIAPTHP
jgi:hypothetical protein